MCENLCIYDTSQKGVDVSVEESETESQSIAEIAKEASKKAIKDTFGIGKPITTLENGYIVKKDQNGNIELIEKIIAETSVISENCGHGINIAKDAKEASRNAIRDTFRLGKPIVTLEGRHIVKKYPNGNIELVKKITDMPVISGNNLYHI